LNPGLCVYYYEAGFFDWNWRSFQFDICDYQLLNSLRAFSNEIQFSCKNMTNEILTECPQCLMTQKL